ncbi:MAG: biopolymer transporter ExbD [Synechococcales cyanobacterium RU_4_20]|nr:biopolymer transporter ExbD [Synechococcales cyanobacterium RU_4_20]NJR68876.1 biopolymer transporter ExbD [Synechococcales cyanobacterium CRU_2_2]
MRLSQDDESDAPAQVNMLPMIDVIFAILAFLIMSTLTLTRVESLPVNLPGAATSRLQQNNLDALITIQPDGTLYLNRDPVTEEGLGDRIQTLKGERPELLVILNADEAVSHGKVVAVMDQLRKLKGVKLAIATRPQ